MRLLAVAVLLGLTVTVYSSWGSSLVAPLPKVVSIQINRCPTPDTYMNHNEHSTIEQKTKRRSRTINAEFEETLRFSPNETGTISFFVVGYNEFTIRVGSSDNVFDPLRGSSKVSANQGGVVLTVPFEVNRAVQESHIWVRTKSATGLKITKIYVSTKSLEPPRPPGIHSSMIYTPEENQVIQESPSDYPVRDINFPVYSNNQETPASQTVPLYNVSDSVATIQPVSNNSGDEVAHTKTLKLDYLVMNRISAGKAEKFEPGNVYYFTINKFESGQVIFKLSGEGKKKVSLKSLTEPSFEKILIAEGDIAAFSYRDGPGYVQEDEIVVKMENDRDEMIFAYITITRI